MYDEIGKMREEVYGQLANELLLLITVYPTLATRESGMWFRRVEEAAEQYI